MKLKLLVCALCLAVGTSLATSAEAGKKPQKKTQWDLQMEEIAQETWEESDLFVVDRMVAEDKAEQAKEAAAAAEAAENPKAPQKTLSRAERKAKAQADKERKLQMARISAAQARYVLHQAQDKVITLQKENNLLQRQIITQKNEADKKNLESKALALAKEIEAAQYMVLGIQQGLQQHDYWAAIASFNQAAALVPNAAWLYDLRGQCYVLLKQRHMAEADYNRATGLSPKTAQYFLNRSRLYGEMGKLAQADADLRYFEHLTEKSRQKDRI